MMVRTKPMKTKSMKGTAMEKMMRVICSAMFRTTPAASPEATGGTCSSRVTAQLLNDSAAVMKRVSQGMF